MALACITGGRECSGCGRCRPEPARREGRKQRVYVGIGPRSGQVIWGDADARGLMYDRVGLVPARGWDGLDPAFLREFDRDMLDWFYDRDWVIYPSEEEYLREPGVQAAYRGLAAAEKAGDAPCPTG